MRIVFAIVIALVYVAASGHQRFAAADEMEFRQACQARLDRLESITYRADAEVRGWDADNPEKPVHSKIQIDALMGCGKRRFRFELQSEEVTNLHTLDQRAFYSCESSSKAAWKVKSSKTITADSDWIMLYPLLLAHGVVPLPPFDLPDLPPKVARRPARSADSPDLKNRDVQFSFDRGRPHRVTISHNRKGLIESYQVTSRGREVLEITNLYRRQGRALRLDRFSATVFGSDGKPNKRVQGQVVECKLNVPTPLEAFAKPRSSKELRRELTSVFGKTVTVEEKMSLDEFAAAVESTAGGNIRVRIDHEALRNPILDPPVDKLTLIEKGEATLGELLLFDLRENRLDFRFDAQGITIIPRYVAWDYVEQVEYAAKDYQVDVVTLRDLLVDGAPPEDWADVGGVAQIEVNYDAETIRVTHGQSDHLLFAELLAEVPKRE